jgi:siroheme synthase
MTVEERPVHIIPDPSAKSSRVYANYVQVSLTPIDCTLTFCDVTGPQSEEEALRMQKSGTLPAPVVVVMVIPTQVVDGLIQALQAQRDKQAGLAIAPTGTTVQ